MSINWTTLLAQIANFFILIWLLKKFLYQPIRRVIAEREQKMTEHIRRGEVMQEEAREQKQLYEAKLREFEAEREERLRDVRSEAEQLRRQLHDEAIHDANKERTLLMEELQQEKAQFAQNLREQVLVQTCEIAGKVIQDLAHGRLEEALIDVLTRQVEQGDAPGVEQAPGQAPASGWNANGPSDDLEPISVRTSFEPSDSEKERLTELAVTFAGHSRISVTFDVDPSLILGIELIGTSEAVSWSARDYLDSLQEVALKQLVHGNPGDRSGAVAGD